MANHKTCGFTLIELMIVILIAGLLMLVAAPFTSKWTASAKITEAQGVLNQAVSRAKAAALRNPNGATVIQVAAAVCGASGSVNVWVATDSTTPASCDTSAISQGTKIWTHKLPSGLTIETITGTTASSFTGLCFDNRGLMVTACGSTGSLNIKVGTVDNHNVQYY